MTVPGFLEKPEPIRLEQIAVLTGATIADPTQRDLLIHDIAPLERAGPGDISYCEGRLYLEELAATQAGACLVSEAQVLQTPKTAAILVTPSPSRAFAVLVGHFYPAALGPSPVTAAGGVSPQAYVSPTAQLEQDVWVVFREVCDHEVRAEEVIDDCALYYITALPVGGPDVEARFSRGRGDQGPKNFDKESA